MCNSHKHIQMNQEVKFNLNAVDPTRTSTLRNIFVRALNKRFNALAAEVRKAVDTEDVFGLRNNSPAVFQTPGPKAFQFGTSQQKIDAFMQWFSTQSKNKIIETVEFNQIGTATNEAWTNMYVRDSYKRGVIRARAELRKAGFSNVPTIEQSGGIDFVMDSPFHIDRLGILYSRTFTDLVGITNQMDTQISRVLAQGLADGDNPRFLARKLVKTITGTGGDLGLTDSLGRFIPAKRRAEILARTEVIRAHHQATVQEYRNFGVAGVKVKAEFRTAGDDRVCSQCANLNGEIFTLDEAMNLIPVHPQCRCIALPFKGPM